MGPAAGNGTKAAELAGYSGGPNTWGRVASELLTKGYIVRAMAARVDADPAVLGRAELMRFWSELTQGRDPYKQTRRIPLQERMDAAATLAKAQGLFVKRIRVERGLDLDVLEGEELDRYRVLLESARLRAEAAATAAGDAAGPVRSRGRPD